MTPDQLNALKENAQDNLNELISLLNHAPGLAQEIKPLVQSPDILAEFRARIESAPDVAEQLLRIALATLVNYHTMVEISHRLKHLDE